MKRKKKPKHLKKELTYGYAQKSFIGFLEGTGKAKHTINSYRSDLRAFFGFLGEESAPHIVKLDRITVHDIQEFDQYLKMNGDRTNTRRRKLLTIRRFLRYLKKRNRLEIDISDQIPTPHKVERVPYTVETSAIVKQIQALTVSSDLEVRNQLLLWTLAESGALVNEVARFRKSDLGKSKTMRWIEVVGKSPRKLPISKALHEALSKVEKTKTGHIFLGFNRHGPMGAAISPRGVELVVKAFAKRIGDKELRPRTFRHSCVVHWSAEGLDRSEIQARLGLKTDYSFRVYDPLIGS